MSPTVVLLKNETFHLTTKNEISHKTSEISTITEIIPTGANLC